MASSSDVTPSSPPAAAAWGGAGLLEAPLMGVWLRRRKSKEGEGQHEWEDVSRAAGESQKGQSERVKQEEAWCC